MSSRRIRRMFDLYRPPEQDVTILKSVDVVVTDHWEGFVRAHIKSGQRGTSTRCMDKTSTKKKRRKPFKMRTPNVFFFVFLIRMESSGPCYES